MVKYENGPVGGWIGYADGDGWVDFHGVDGDVLRWYADGRCEAR